MDNNAEELDLRNIMQGLEEFATFMSFKSELSGVRILSVESVEQDRQQTKDKTADIVELHPYIKKRPSGHNINRSLSFSDR